MFPRISLAILLGSGAALCGSTDTTRPSAVHLAREFADRAADESIRDELRQEVATTLVRLGKSTDALALAAQLSPASRARVLLEAAAHLPRARAAEAEQLILDAQTAKAMTRDWRKLRLTRLLAVGHARLNHFTAAEALAQSVPDTEEKASAQQEIVVELCRAGNVAHARELAATIEENRRYGTYRQKAMALAVTASALHRRGNPDDALTLLAQAELLLPRKPGWSEGAALLAVAEARHVIGQTEMAAEMVARAASLAEAIGGSWKVHELVRVAAAWRRLGNEARASDTLREAARFMATLPPLDRAEQAPALAQGWCELGDAARARATLQATLAEASSGGNQEAWRKPRVHLLLAWAELLGDAPPPPASAQ